MQDFSMGRSDRTRGSCNRREKWPVVALKYRNIVDNADGSNIYLRLESIRLSLKMTEQSTLLKAGSMRHSTRNGQ